MGDLYYAEDYYAECTPESFDYPDCMDAETDFYDGNGDGKRGMMDGDRDGDREGPSKMPLYMFWGYSSAMTFGTFWYYTQEGLTMTNAEDYNGMFYST